MGPSRQRAPLGRDQRNDAARAASDQTLTATRARRERSSACSSRRIRKGKAGKVNGFGKLVEVYDRQPSDTDVLIPAIETHEAVLGRTPRLLAADAGFYSAKNEAAAKAKGVKRVSIPNRSTKSLERKRVQKKRGFRNGQKWRKAGCEGRISVIKRRHGLTRAATGATGMKRWVGLGVIADNLISMGNAIAKQAK